jgi:hypothetical protein
LGIVLNIKNALPFSQNNPRVPRGHIQIKFIPGDIKHVAPK